jgi:hypothetical protein
MSSFTEPDLSCDTFVFSGRDIDGDGQTDADGIRKYSDCSTTDVVKDDPDAWAVTQAGLVKHDGPRYLPLALDRDGDGTADGLTITKYVDKSSAGLVDASTPWLAFTDSDASPITKKMDSSSLTPRLYDTPAEVAALLDGAECGLG